MRRRKQNKTKSGNFFKVPFVTIFIGLFILSITPSFFIVKYGFTLSDNACIQFLLILTSFISFLIASITFPLLIKRILGISLKEEEFRITETKRMARWQLSQALFFFPFGLYGSFRYTKQLLYTMYGAKIGKNCMIAGDLIDPELVEIGDNTFMGMGSSIYPHMVEGKKIILRKVVVGKNCTIGSDTLIMPGVRVGNGSIVGSKSLIPKFKEIESNSVYVGVPVRLIRKRDDEVV